MTINNTNQKDIVKNKFDEIWSDDKRGYDDLVCKMQNPKHIVHGDATINLVNRAVMTNRFIMENYPKGSLIIDAGCGNGFNTCYLAKEGFKVMGFDIAPNGIKRSKELAKKVGVDQNIFEVGDHTILGRYKSNSIHIVCALGLMRYLGDSDRDLIYNEIYRILQPGGCFAVSNDNILFDMFALNNATLEFWSKLIEEFSDIHVLLNDKPILDVLKEYIQVPQRQYTQRSVSCYINKHSENPLIFAKNMKKRYGYNLKQIVYPDCHLLPPFMETMVDTEQLEKMKGEYCLSRAENDWRSMFFGFEFLSFLIK